MKLYLSDDDGVLTGVAVLTERATVLVEGQAVIPLEDAVIAEEDADSAIGSPPLVVVPASTYVHGFL